MKKKQFDIEEGAADDIKLEISVEEGLIRSERIIEIPSDPRDEEEEDNMSKENILDIPDDLREEEEAELIELRMKVEVLAKHGHEYRKFALKQAIDLHKKMDVESEMRGIEMDLKNKKLTEDLENERVQNRNNQRKESALQSQNLELITQREKENKDRRIRFPLTVLMFSLLVGTLSGFVVHLAHVHT